MKSVLEGSNRLMFVVYLFAAAFLLAVFIQIPHAAAQSSPTQLSASAPTFFAVNYFNYNGGSSRNQWGCSDCGTCSQWGGP